MALRTYVSSGVYDTHLGSATITASTAALTSAGITSSGVTAPNLVNAITGCWICVAVLPTNGGNITVEIMESVVSKKTATINSADIQLGMNYVRFATSYTFATLTASAYTARVKNSVGTSGSLRTAASGLWFQFTYDTASAYGSSDDIWVGGFNDAGLTAKNLVLSGTTTFGSKATTAIGSTTQTMGAAVTCGSGGTFSYDQTASVNFTIKGSFWCTAGGVIDLRPPSGDKTIIHTTIIDSTANGDQGIFSATGATGGQILTTGATYTQYALYASGTGTAADPLIVSTAWDADVNDEVVIPGILYNTNQIRYIKTRNSSTSFVLSATAGGAESAITNTPYPGMHLANLTRNSIIKPLTTNLGYYLDNASNTAGNFNYTRFEHSDNNSGKALSFSGISVVAGGATSSFDGIVAYNNSNGASGRQWLSMPSSGDPATETFTHTGITAYNTGGSNYAGSSGVRLLGTANKTMNWILHYNGSSTTTAAAITLNTSSTSNTFNNCYSYGANGGNSATGYAIGIFSSSGNTFNNSGVVSARTNAVYLSGGADNTFNNCAFSGNTIDIDCVTGTLNQALFNNCLLVSTTLISNYLNQLDTSSINFQDFGYDTSSHRWYTNKGSWWSSGSGLTDTTVRTASSLALASKPENNSTGSSWTFKIPASPTSNVGIFGYVYRNATFSSGTLKVELFLPGTLLTATPDDTFTFATTTGSWLPFNISAYYSGAVARYAQVRITGITATAGAYFFIDDLYDAGTGNKVAGLDLWDNGKPSDIMVSVDYSSIPAQVWGFSDSGTSASTMGQRQVDGADDAELAAIK